MSNESTKKTLLVTILLSLVCSIVVSAAAVLLKSKQDKNKIIDIQRNIIAISGLSKNVKTLTNIEVEEIFKKITPRLVDLKKGRFIDASANIINAYDQRIAANDPKSSHTLTPSQDIALIKRIPEVAKVYEIFENGKLIKLILPIYGYGLWSTLYGFIALEGNLNTVVGASFYEHGETPGLGGEVDNPAWKSKWPGKKVYNNDGLVALTVIKGSVNNSTASAKYQIDGLAGATLTSNGVTNLLHFWMGDNGFKPFLEYLKSEGM